MSGLKLRDAIQNFRFRPNNSLVPTGGFVVVQRL
jgi:hypothetical protein